MRDKAEAGSAGRHCSRTSFPPTLTGVWRCDMIRSTKGGGVQMSERIGCAGSTNTLHTVSKVGGHC
jgi:hypothetical protein